jgi:hypothetical protein
LDNISYESARFLLLLIEECKLSPEKALWRGFFLKSQEEQYNPVGPLKEIRNSNGPDETKN